MTKWTNKVKAAFLKSLESLGKSASNMADNAHDRLNEMNLQTRRREILSEFPLQALEMFQNGMTFPEPLNEMLVELNELDAQLAVLRAQRYAKVEDETQPGEEPAAASEDASEDAEITPADTQDEEQHNEVLWEFPVEEANVFEEAAEEIDCAPEVTEDPESEDDEPSEEAVSPDAPAEENTEN